MSILGKTTKQNIMGRICILCSLVIVVIGFLIYKGEQPYGYSFDIISFIRNRRWLLIYLIVINVLTFFLFALDKVKAIRGTSRISIATLLRFTAIGGAIGALIGMYLLRHKTRKIYFTLGVPMILFTQLLCIFYLMNRI